MKNNDNFIKDFWDNQAEIHKESYKASWGDINAISLEIQAISEYLADDQIVLDAGCGNGYSTFLQSISYDFKKIIGVDFSESMIKFTKDKEYSDIEFKVGNILNLDFKDDYFDVAYTTRTLINLPTWEQQIQAFNELYRVTKPGGKILLSEAFWEPLCKLNSLRLILGLDPLVEHDFNRYLKKEKFEKLLKDKNLFFINNNFSSVYYFGSRLLRELLTKEFIDYKNPINDLFFELSQKFTAKNDIGIQQLYVIWKK